ncbi:hypothetical protein APF79_11845 [bacterium BRH_c32]|nr:MAG: hypothetical protein APF79_11845 [bacterium BRH_c32]
MSGARIFFILFILNSLLSAQRKDSAFTHSNSDLALSGSILVWNGLSPSGTDSNITQTVSKISQLDSTLSRPDSVFSEIFFESDQLETNYFDDLFDIIYTIPNNLQEGNFSIKSRLKNQFFPKQPESYKGDNYKLYNRLIADVGKTRFSIVTEKDAGEENYLDFINLSLMIKDIYPINKIILGSYNIEFGEGLILWSPFRTYKSSNEIFRIRSNKNNLNQYIGSNETTFLSGAASSFTFGDFYITPFYSQRKLDGYKTPTGLHRTENEIAKTNINREILYGGMLNFFKKDIIEAGFLFYNQENQNFYSLSYKSKYNRIGISGEVAYLNSTAFSNSITLRLSGNNFLYSKIRYFPKYFYSSYSGAFAEGVNSNNETGFYLGINSEIIPSLRLDAYVDFFKRSSPDSLFNFFQNGKEYFINLTYKIRKQDELRISFKQKESFNSTKRNSLKFYYIFQLFSELSLSTRFDYVSVDCIMKKEEGFHLFEEISYRPSKKFQVNFRVSFFSTPSYDSRIYVYERDVNGIFSNFIAYNRGIHVYLLSKFTITNRFKLGLKYSDSLKSEEFDSISLKKSNRNNNLTIQIEAAF